MNVFKDSFKAAAIAIPLALAAPAATAKSPSPELSYAVENTRARVGNAVTGAIVTNIVQTRTAVARFVTIQDSNAWNQLSNDLSEEVRFHLHVERCFVLNNQSKNAPEWLAAINELDRVNSEIAGKYDEKSQDSFERAKERLQTARAKAGVPFHHIMDGSRTMKENEKSCLIRKTKTRM